LEARPRLSARLQRSVRGPSHRDAILAAEDKNFVSHSGIDYRSFARVLGKIRFGDLMGGLARMGK
jgi:membrane carboxypeptidase/penicillin-binding protein